MVTMVRVLDTASGSVTITGGRVSRSVAVLVESDVAVEMGVEIPVTVWLVVIIEVVWAFVTEKDRPNKTPFSTQVRDLITSSTHLWVGDGTASHEYVFNKRMKALGNGAYEALPGRVMKLDGTHQADS
jgi:hypothetical protein